MINFDEFDIEEYKDNLYELYINKEYKKIIGREVKMKTDRSVFRNVTGKVIGIVTSSRHPINVYWHKFGMTLQYKPDDLKFVETNNDKL